MTAYSNQNLESMLSDIESDLVERKESSKGDTPSKAREAVCAFANDLPGHGRPGVVFVGARDDGSPSGLSVTDELLFQLADMTTDGNIVPPPTLTVARHTSSALTDLDRRRFEDEYLPAAFASDVLAANDRSYELQTGLERGLRLPAQPRVRPRHIRGEPDFGVASVNYDFGELLDRADEPL